jgi:hypothetical protein
MRDVSRNTADILELCEIFWRNYTMTKIELLRQYIHDLKSHVPESQGRDNRIAVLEEELEHEQLQNKSSNSDYTNCPHWKVYNKGGSGEFGVCDCQGRLK